MGIWLDSFRSNHASLVTVCLVSGPDKLLIQFTRRDAHIFLILVIQLSSRDRTGTVPSLYVYILCNVFLSLFFGGGHTKCLLLSENVPYVQGNI